MKNISLSSIFFSEKVVALASLKLYYLPVRNDERKLDSKTAKLLLIKGIFIPFNKLYIQNIHNRP